MSPSSRLEVSLPVHTPESLRKTCLALKQEALELRRWSASELIEALGDWLQAWQNPSYPYRLEAVRRLAEGPGFHPLVSQAGLDALFGAWSGAHMRRLFELELGQAGFTGKHAWGEREVIFQQVGPRLVAHVLAGNVPPPTLQSLLAALLVRSPSLLKAPSSEPGFAALLVASLRECVPALGKAVAVGVWPGGEAGLEAVLFEQAELVVAYGSDQTLGLIQPRVRPPRRFIGRGHRLSVGYVTGAALDADPEGVALALARDVALFDQEGCLSPHAVVVERGKRESGLSFVEHLARAFAQVARELPAGRLEAGRAALVAQRRGVLAFTGELREGAGWAVALTEEARFQPSCLGRTLVVKEVSDEEEGLGWLEPAYPVLQAVALGAVGEHFVELGRRFGRRGAGRVCRPGALQSPPAFWGDLGRPVLRELVRKVSIEP